MPELFKLVKENFSEKDNEYQWTYLCLFSFTFKRKIIEEITITDYPLKKRGREWITKELILDLLKEKINGIKRMRPRKRYENRDIFVRERLLYREKRYRLIFWFKDETTNHLWIRNCHPQD